jgi:hypothetical protein
MGLAISYPLTNLAENIMIEITEQEARLICYHLKQQTHSLIEAPQLAESIQAKLDTMLELKLPNKVLHVSLQNTGYDITGNEYIINYFENMANKDNNLTNIRSYFQK